MTYDARIDSCSTGIAEGHPSRRGWFLAWAALVCLSAAGCARLEPPQRVFPDQVAASVPQREFLSDAQAARARYYWSAEALEPYGVEPAWSARSSRSGS
jgi:hypothetical protein